MKKLKLNTSQNKKEDEIPQKQDTNYLTKLQNKNESTNGNSNHSKYTVN